MKALSLRQPWAWVVALGVKTIENRYWNTKTRGPILIHAAKGCTRAEYESSAAWIEKVAKEVGAPVRVPPLADLMRGGIVAKANIVEVLPPCGDAISCFHPWHMPEQYGFVLANIEAVPFRPMTGMLGFFEVPA